MGNRCCIQRGSESIAVLRRLASAAFSESRSRSSDAHHAPKNCRMAAATASICSSVSSG